MKGMRYFYQGRKLEHKPAFYQTALSRPFRTSIAMNYHSTLKKEFLWSILQIQDNKSIRKNSRGSCFLLPRCSIGFTITVLLIFLKWNFTSKLWKAKTIKTTSIWSPKHAKESIRSASNLSTVVYYKVKTLKRNSEIDTAIEKGY